MAAKRNTKTIPTASPAPQPPPGIEVQLEKRDDDRRGQHDPVQPVDLPMSRDNYTDLLPGRKSIQRYDPVNPVRPSSAGIPGSMNNFERRGLVQLFILAVTILIAVLNVILNFRLIGLFDEQLARLSALSEPTELSQQDKDSLLASFEILTVEEDAGDVCDIPFFLGGFQLNDLLEPIKTIGRIAKASAYFSAIFVVGLHIVIKSLSTYNLVHQDFDVADATEMLANRSDNLLVAQTGGVKSKKNKFDLIKTKAVNNSLILESEGEKHVRTYLRAETILFGLIQVFQDIPQGTCTILLILLETRERGILCYEEMLNNKVSKISSLDKVNAIVFAQLGIIILNMFWNMLFLGIRWIKYFHHKTAKNFKKPVSMTIRIAQSTVWVFGYILAVFMPVFAISYSPIGEELFGLQTTGEVFFLVLTVLGAVFGAIGLILVCCFWGVQTLGNLCVCFVVCEALAIGCDAFWEFEACELMMDGCC